VFYCNYNSFTSIVSLRKQYVQVSVHRARLSAQRSQNIGDGSGYIELTKSVFRFELSQTVWKLQAPNPIAAFLFTIYLGL
jgi:hypothetical protein